MIRDVLQIQNRSCLDHVKIHVRRITAPDVLLADLALPAALVHRIVWVASVHQDLEDQDRQPEQIIVGSPVHVLESHPHEPRGSEIFLPHGASMHFARLGVRRLYGVKIDD